MKFTDLDRSLVNHAGEKFTDIPTIRHLLISAAVAALPGRTDPSNRLYALGLLAVKLHNAKDEIEIEAEDIAALKDRVAAMFSPIVVLRAFDFLEGKQDAEERL